MVSPYSHTCRHCRSVSSAIMSLPAHKGSDATHQKDHERFSRQVPLQTNCAAFKAAESLGADFVECLNRTAEIGAAVDAVS